MMYVFIPSLCIVCGVSTFGSVFYRSPPEAAASKIVENCHKNRQKSSKIVENRQNRQKSLDAFCRCRFWEKKDWVLATVNFFVKNGHKNRQKSSKIVENSHENRQKSSKIVENRQKSSKNRQKSSDDFCDFRRCRFWGGTLFAHFEPKLRKRPKLQNPINPEIFDCERKYFTEFLDTLRGSQHII